MRSCWLSEWLPEEGSDLDSVAEAAQASQESSLIGLRVPEMECAYHEMAQSLLSVISTVIRFFEVDLVVWLAQSR